MPKPSREMIVKALDDLVKAIRLRFNGKISKEQLLTVAERAYLVLERERAEEDTDERKGNT